MISSAEKEKSGGEPSSDPMISRADLKTSAAICHYMKLKESIEMHFYEVKKYQAALEELKKSKETQGNFVKLGKLFIKEKKEDLEEEMKENIRNLELAMIRNLELKNVIHEKVRQGFDKPTNKAPNNSDDDSDKRECE